MNFKHQTDWLPALQFYHRIPVRTLIISIQGNGYYEAFILMKKIGSPYTINEIMFYLTEKVKRLIIYQEKKIVNLHSQLCAHNPRFRPS